MRNLRSLALLPLALALLLLPSPAANAAASPEEEARAVLQTQAAAWSRGDLEAFSSVYADDATFLATTGVTRGGKEVLARYRKRYPDAAAMGKLTLEVIEARAFPEGSAAVGVSIAARWRLEYPNQPDKKTAEGLTLVVMKKIGGAWKIVQDASM